MGKGIIAKGIIMAVVLAVFLQLVLALSGVNLAGGALDADQDDDDDGRDQRITVEGGGTGTFNADLDGDEDIDGSYFWMDVAISSDGSAQGHFMCLMAGPFDFLDLPLMLVEGQVTRGKGSRHKTATFSGVGNVNLGDGRFFTDVPFTVMVTKGGPGAGSLALTVIGAFDGVPGDTIIGNSNYDLPVEMVASGRINFHRGENSEDDDN